MTRRIAVAATGPVPQVVLTLAREIDGHLTPWGKATEVGADPQVVIDPRSIQSVVIADMWTHVHYMHTLSAGMPRAAVAVVEESPGVVFERIREALATAPDASDETRLAAGWMQEFRGYSAMLPCYYSPLGGVTHESVCTPAPLPAGGWRHIGDGRSMRWVLAEVPDVG